MTRPLSLLLLFFSLAAAPAWAQQGTLYLVFTQEAEIVEGDDGTRTVTLDYEVSGSAAREVRFTYSTETPADMLGYASTADAGVDYVAIPPTTVVLPPAVRSGSLQIQVRGDRFAEPDQSFSVIVEDIAGARTPTNQTFDFLQVTIRDDDAPLPPPVLVVRDDLAGVPGSQSVSIQPLGNDRYTGSGRFELTDAPSHGTASSTSDPTYLDGIVVRYQPGDTFTGSDEFGYRLCLSGGECAEGRIRVVPRIFESWEVDSAGRSGRATRQFTNEVPFPSPRFQASALVAPVPERWEMDADFSPATPWDSDEGVTWRYYPLPALAEGGTAGFRVHVDVDNDRPNADYVQLYIGADADGNGRPSPGEVACQAGGTKPSCSFVLEQGGALQGYWVQLHNWKTDLVRATTLRYEIPLQPGDGSLVATGPGRLPQAERATLTLSWRDGRLLEFLPHRGNLRVLTEAGAVPGDIPVAITAGVGSEEPLFPLFPAEVHDFAIAPGQSLDTLFFDVPAGASRLEVRVDTDAPMDFYLVRSLEVMHPEAFAPGPAPDPSQQAASLSSQGGEGSLVVEGAALAAGRWYLVPSNPGPAVANLQVSHDIEGLSPVVRPGSYFNAGRPGSGLFLYPAGDQWAGLWYTYRHDRKPTWYYLQGPAPGENGLWTTPIYRAAWDGDTRQLVAVGSATMSATDPDRFTFTYLLDGIAGTQPFQGLGRGCPSLAGAPVDGSGHWFDPLKAGTGYSAQLWPDYEYYAAFIYDTLGEPLFMAAENSGFAGEDAILELQYLTGACPTCGFFASSRGNVGTYRRVYGAGVLREVEMDAEYPDQAGVYGWAAWSSSDAVQALGATQGCAP